MESDSDVLLQKINSLNNYSKRFIEKIKLWEGKDLFLLKKDYPLLPYQIKSHELIRIESSLADNIINEMKLNNSLKILLSIDFQFFLSLFDNFNDFLDYFKKDLKRFNTNNLKYLFDEIKKTCFEDYDDIDKKGLKIIHFFGIISPFYKDGKLDFDEPKIFFSKLLEIYYFKNVRKLKQSNVDFKEDILSPLENLFKLLGEAQFVNKDDKNFFIVDEENIHRESLQNFFCCLQYHCFFEDYVNNLFSKFGEVIKNPLILFNPSEREKDNKKIIEGYFEMDGSICISKNKELCIIECKNGDMVHPSHLTQFIGKVHFIEKIYDIKTQKHLFSTGLRFQLWENLEDFSSCSDIKIHCRRSFCNDFKDLVII